MYMIQKSQNESFLTPVYKVLGNPIFCEQIQIVLSSDLVIEAVCELKSDSNEPGSSD